jgi:hypothetical protein
MNGGRIFNTPRTDSTPLPWPISATGPALAVCPVSTVAMTCLSPASVQEIYRLAYEQALAAVRPSVYEMTLIAFPN